ncbi:hypothetical protein SBDP1_40035 [Syntrophobacter sp. SbD1]|nr:hypothetical protein SBDP1_40035 [Syntrophobacter sp. SbD1]
MSTETSESAFARACSGQSESPKISTANLVTVGGGSPEPEPKTVAEKMFPGLEPIKEPGPRQPLSALQAAVSGQTARDPVQQPAQQQADGVKFVEVDNPDLVPAHLEGYTIPIEGADPKLATFLKTTAHELNMTRKQTSLLAQKYDQMVKTQMETQRKAAELTTQAVTGELKTIWGAEFEGNSRTVQEFTTGLSDAQFTSLVQRLLHAEAKRGR